MGKGMMMGPQTGLSQRGRVMATALLAMVSLTGCDDQAQAQENQDWIGVRPVNAMPLHGQTGSTLPAPTPQPVAVQESWRGSAAAPTPAAAAPAPGPAPVTRASLPPVRTWAPASAPSVASDASAPPQTDQGYMIQPGDTLFSIAKRHQVALQDVVQLNGLVPPYTLTPGQVLRLPGRVAPTPMQTQTQTRSQIQTRTEASEEAAWDSVPPRVQDSALTTSHHYRVQEGDTLYSIAKRFGIDLNRLAALNGIVAPGYAIRVGQRLQVPNNAVSAPPHAAAPLRATAAPRAAVTPTQPPCPAEGQGDAPTAASLPQTAATGALGLREHGQGIASDAAHPDIAVVDKVLAGLDPVDSADPAPSVPRSQPVPPRASAAPQRKDAPTQASLPAPLPDSASRRLPGAGQAVTTPAAPSHASREPSFPSASTVAALPVPKPEADHIPPPPQSEAGAQQRLISNRLPAQAPTQAEERDNSQIAAVSPQAADASAKQEPIPAPPPRSRTAFLWPVRGQILSDFGSRSDGRHNDGINIAAPRGTPVKAAENGVVAYAGNELRGFGNLILLKHADGWMTAYAHNDAILVERGAEVKRGQPIARVGATGNVDTSQLHFEIRRGSKAVNPRAYLVGSGNIAAAQ